VAQRLRQLLAVLTAAIFCACVRFVAGTAVGQALHPHPDGCDGPCFIVDRDTPITGLGILLGAVLFSGAVVVTQRKRSGRE